MQRAASLVGVIVSLLVHASPAANADAVKRTPTEARFDALFRALPEEPTTTRTLPMYAFRAADASGKIYSVTSVENYPGAEAWNTAMSFTPNCGNAHVCSAGIVYGYHSLALPKGERVRLPDGTEGVYIKPGIGAYCGDGMLHFVRDGEHLAVGEKCATVATLRAMAARLYRISSGPPSRDEVRRWLASAPTITTTKRMSGTEAVPYVKLSDADIEGFELTAAHGTLANGQEVLAVPLAGRDDGQTRHLLLFTRVDGVKRFVGDVPAPNGGLRAVVANGFLYTESTEPTRDYSRKLRVDQYTLRGIRLVSVQSVVIAAPSF